MFDALGLHFGPTEELPAPDQCLRDVLRSQDTYTLDAREVVRPYDPARISVLHSTHRPVELLPLLDADTRKLALEAGTRMIRPQPPRAAAQFAVYSDPKLRERGVLLELIKLLERNSACTKSLPQKTLHEINV